MTKFIIALLLFVTSTARASDVEACFNLCQLVTEESKNLKCEITTLGESAILYLDVLKKPLSTRDKLQFNSILSCYFKTGGGFGEIHWADNSKYIAVCGPEPRTRMGYSCDRTDAKRSARNLKKK